jgi:ABC-type multidrug transport system fused ATPase/permease subunit
MKNGPLAGRRLPVAAAMTFGRQDVDVVIDDSSVSRRHARMRIVDGGLEIDDLGSKNGTWVNGQRIEGPARLAAGDVVAVGGVLMVVEWEPAAGLLSAPTRVTDALPAWQTWAGRRVSVHAPEQSYAARRAAAELRDAERAGEVLEQLIAPPGHAEELVEIYLTEAVAGAAAGRPRAPGGTASPSAVVRVVQPEAPGAPIAYPLARVLVERWFGAAAASASLVVSGLGGLVAARTSAGPAVEEADEDVLAETAAGRTVSVFAHRDAEDDDPAPDAVATSFVAFLLRAYGPDPMRRFLEAYDPERRDAAATLAYQRPLGSLEELWLVSLHQVSGFRATLRALLGHLWPLMKPYRLRWLEIFAYMLLGIAYTITLPLAFKYLFDTVIPDGSLRRLGIFVGVLFVIFVASTLVTMRRTYVTALVNQHVLFGLQGRMFEQLQRLSHSFYGRAKVGDLMARLSQDLNTVQEATSAVLAQGLFLALSALAAAVTALVLSPLLGALVLVVVPLFSVSYVLLLSRLRTASFEVQTIYGHVAASIQENLSAHAVVKAFGLEDRAIASYRGRLAGLLRSLLRVVLLSSVFEASVSMAVTLGQLLVIGVGGYLVIDGQVTLGTLVAFVGLLPTFFQPITALANVGQEVQRAAGAIDRMLEILEEPVEIAELPSAAPLPPIARDVRLERVSFGYDRDRLILRGVDMTIPAGRHVAVVGPSGSGKSTIVNLLLRFWDPQQGRVLFDGRDAREVTVASLRGQIGLVFQDTFVFDTTVRENIALAREGATDADVLAAARAARLETWIESLPAGPDTVLGERGVRMSGGQRQRLAIARALLRNPSLLILDEATSALDAQTEAEILETLAEAAAGRTTISITHRLSLAARADYVFVLEQGRLVEAGTHAELSRAGGPYQRLHDEQTAYVTAGLAPLPIEIGRLRAIPLFADLGPDELAEVAQRLTAEEFGAGEIVMRQGEAGGKLYLIASGQVEIVAREDGRDRRVNTLNDGDYFGEMALLTDEPRAATVRTTMPTELFSLTRGDFLALLEHDPAARDGVRERVAARRLALEHALRAGTRVSAVVRPTSSA